MTDLRAGTRFSDGQFFDSVRVDSARVRSGGARRASRALLLGALLALPGLVSCVPLVKYDQATKELDRANEINADLKSALRQKEGEIAQLRSGDRVATVEFSALRQRASGLEDENSILRAKNAELEAQLRDQLTMPPIPQFTDDDAASTGLNITAEGALLLEGALFFDSGKHTLKKKLQPELDRLAETLNGKYSGRRIFIDGHTDNVPITKSKDVNQDNWDLSAKRAHSVFAYLIAKGVDSDRFVLRGFGYAQPPTGTSFRSDKEKAAARRVEIRLGS